MHEIEIGAISKLILPALYLHAIFNVTTQYIKAKLAWLRKASTS